MPDSPANRPVALVTGAGTGTGRAIALLLAASGYRLVLVGRRRPPLEKTLGELAEPANHLIATADVSDTKQIGPAIDRAMDHFGRLDALINNAGTAPLLPIDKTTPEVLEACFRTNAIGPAWAIAKAWPIFKRERSGCIINISSMATHDPFPGFFAYAASKASVNLMAHSCAKEGREFNIRAFSIAPGAIETPLLRAAFPVSVLPPEKCLRPEQVAQLVLECLSGKHDDRNGQTIQLPSP